MAQLINTGSSVSNGISAFPAGKSAASWPAIFAGAVAAVGISIVLLALGSGFGFAAVSPWADHGITPTTFAVTTAIWLIVTQWVSSGIGGYLAGRLRTKWVGTHTHEVFFRDTAHGLVTWAVATVVVTALAASSAFTAIGGAAHAAAETAAAGMHGVGHGVALETGDYDLDKLFRSSGGSVGASDAAGTRSQVISTFAGPSGRI